MNYHMTFSIISDMIQGRVTLLVGITLGVTTKIVTFFVRNLVQSIVFRNHIYGEGGREMWQWATDAYKISQIKPKL